MKSKPSGVVICGTDTDVGKTVVSALIVQGLKGIYWKPIQSGINDGGDTDRVCKLLNLPKTRFLKEAYRFKAPVSPHWAAEKENRWVDPKKLKLPLVKDPLIVETAGGLLVPLNRDLLQIDQLKQWDLPVVLVARTGLGTLNHSLMSIEALKNRDIKLLGLIMNGPAHKDNFKTLEQIGDVEVIAHLNRISKLNGKALAEQWKKQQLGISFNRLLKVGSHLN